MPRFLQSLGDLLSSRRDLSRKYAERLAARDLDGASSALRRRRIDASAMLEAALRLGPAAHARELCLRGADPDAPLSGAPPLLIAHQSPLEAAAKRDALVAAGAKVDGVIGPRRWTLLGFACFVGDAGFARFLLERRADPRKRDRNGLTPMLMARAGGHEPLARLLAGYGAEDERPTLAQLEPNFISDNGFHSQVHEAIKMGLLRGEARLSRVELKLPLLGARAEAEFDYFTELGGREYRVEALFLEGGGLQAVWQDASSGAVLVDLLAGARGGQATLRELRGTIQKTVEDTRAGRVAGHPGRGPSESPAGEGARAPASWDLPEDVQAAYLALGVAPGAGSGEALRAYRRLAKAYHPDLAAGASERKKEELGRKMAELNEAYRKVGGRGRKA